MLLLRDYMAENLSRLSSTHRNERWKTWSSREVSPNVIRSLGTATESTSIPTVRYISGIGNIGQHVSRDVRRGTNTSAGYKDWLRCPVLHGRRPKVPAQAAHHPVSPSLQIYPGMGSPAVQAWPESCNSVGPDPMAEPVGLRPSK
jgi:hypothetical protein